LDDSKQDIKKTLRDLRRHTRVSYGTNAEKKLGSLGKWPINTVCT